MTKSKYVLNLFQGSDGLWRWNLVARKGGKTVATSGESFADKGKAKRAASSLSRIFSESGRTLGHVPIEG